MSEETAPYGTGPAKADGPQPPHRSSGSAPTTCAR